MQSECTLTVFANKIKQTRLHLRPANLLIHITANAWLNLKRRWAGQTYLVEVELKCCA